MKKTKKMRKMIKQAKMGKVPMMYQVGICYQVGIECEKDMNKAAMWMHFAAQENYEPAIQWLQDYYFDDDTFLQAVS